MKQSKLLLYFVLSGLIFTGFLFVPKKALAGEAENKKLLQSQSSYIQKACGKYIRYSKSKLRDCIRRESSIEYNRKILQRESSKVQRRCNRYIEASKDDMLNCIRRETGREVGISIIGRQPIIRVGILGTKKKVKLTANGEFYIRDKNNKTLKTLPANRTVEVSMSGSRYVVKGRGVNLKMSSYPRFVSRRAIMNVLSPKEYYHRFKNTIEVRKGGDGKLWVINEIPLENYIAGLGECGNSGPKEYIKALGVAARTYAYYWKSKGGRHPSNHFDVWDTASDQLYYGYDYERKIPRAVQIFRSVGGEMVTYKGQPIAAVYHSASGGKTKNGPHPYLRSVSDPYGGKTRLGHGMGLSAQGAVGYAKHGKSYKWILKHYYRGTRVQKIY